MKLIKVFFIGSVCCGNHEANTCADCPQGKGAHWCNGDCKWVNGQCQFRNGNYGIWYSKASGHWILGNTRDRGLNTGYQSTRGSRCPNGDWKKAKVKIICE